MKNIIMYLSAFIPMFWIMIIRDGLELAINGKGNFCALINAYLIIAFVFAMLLTTAFAAMFVRKKGLSEELATVKSIKNRAAEYYLGYFSLFIITLLCFKLTNFIDIITLSLILFALGVVYIKNELYFMNPTINLFMAYLYEIEYDNGKDVLKKIIISKNEIKTGQSIYIIASEYDFAFTSQHKTGHQAKERIYGSN
jgi:hypothetical protein